jgi:hypothetical protein
MPPPAVRFVTHEPLTAPSSSVNSYAEAPCAAISIPNEIAALIFVFDITLFPCLLSSRSNMKGGGAMLRMRRHSLTLRYRSLTERRFSDE